MYFWKDRVNELVVSESEGELFKIVAAEFGSFISYRSAESNQKLLLAHFEQRDVSRMRLPSGEAVYRLAHRLMRILSLTIRPRKESGQETVLVIGDWTNKKRIDSSQKNYKYTNRWSLKGVHSWCAASQDDESIYRIFHHKLMMNRYELISRRD